MPGYDVRIIDAEGAEVATGEMGEVAPKLPLPPGAAVTLWNANDQFEESYLLGGDSRPSLRGTVQLSDLCPTEGVRHIVVTAATAEKHQRHQPATD
jgi:hypothetical protein